MIPVRRSLLKKAAKKIKKLRGLKLSMAYDAAAVDFGFNNYRHYLNSLKNSEPRLNMALPSSIPDKRSSSFTFLNESNDAELDQLCQKKGVKDEVTEYLLHLFNIRKLTVPGYVFCNAEDFDFEFIDFVYRPKNFYLDVSGGILITVKPFLGKNYENRSAIKRSRQFRCDFLVNIDSDKIFLREVKVIDEP